MNEFGLRLKELRESAGLTQPQLAERSGLKKAGIANLEQGRRSPAWATVQALCTALGVDCTAFNIAPAAGTAPRGRGRPTKEAAAEAPAVKPPRAKRRSAKR